MSADSPRRGWSNSGSGTRGLAVPAMVPPQVVSDRSILDSAIGFINDVTLAHQPHTDPKDTITWARFEIGADISDPCFGDDWELEGNMTPPLLLVLGYGLGVQVWAIPANGEAVEVLSWRHGVVSTLRILPTPSSVFGNSDNMRADDIIDVYSDKRPLIALVDGSSTPGAQPQFSSVNIISLKFGTQVKTMKFKNPVIDILANRFAIVITFHERIAVFDARTLEDRLSVTTCYPSPGINPNPIALGTRWLAYAEHKLIHAKRSSGGCDGESVASYTATVLNAAKSLGRGLKELGEQVAAGLTGAPTTGSLSKNNSFDSTTGADAKQPGVVTIMDIKNPIRDYSPTNGLPISSSQAIGTDPVIVHFIAHSEALVAMEFDYSGMLLLTADRRGHDFHVFRIQPQPVGSSLAAVHHLYVLHRGDTSAKVQNISFSLDSRWVAISTLRGTTHVFPITPYGGPIGVRTHTSLHVVNKLSRFHRSAGLSADGRSNSPISHSESTTFTQSLQPYHNPTLPPFPRPTIILPLAQLRQPSALSSPPGSATLTSVSKSIGGGSGAVPQRQRLSSLSDDNGKPLSVCAVFAKSRSWLLEPPNATRDAPHRMQRKPVDSLFVMAGHGALIQYDLDTKLASNVAKEKICHDTPIELIVEAKAQWNLGRRKEGSQEIMPPLKNDNWLLRERNPHKLTDSMRQYYDADDRGDSWLAQVEIVTHAGPHRRLWMGPQFVFKTYNSPSGSSLNHVDTEAIEIGISKAASKTSTAERSSPLNMPLISGSRSGAVPVLIESGSYSSIEHSPKLMDRFRHDHLNSDYSIAYGDTQLKEDLADAMRESPSVSITQRNDGRRNFAAEAVNTTTTDNPTFYDAIGDYDEIDSDPHFDDHYLTGLRKATLTALANALPNIHSYDDELHLAGNTDNVWDKHKNSVEKIVNPLGTVTTVTTCLTSDLQTDILDEVVSQLAAEDAVIHENCDESLFRPVVTIFCDEKLQAEDAARAEEFCKPPELISNKLIVPVIAKEIDEAISKKEKQKLSSKKQKLLAKENLRRGMVSKAEATDTGDRKDTLAKGVKADNKCTSLEKCSVWVNSNKNNATPHMMTKDMVGLSSNIQTQQDIGSRYEKNYIRKTSEKSDCATTSRTKFTTKSVEKPATYGNGKPGSHKMQATTAETEHKNNHLKTYNNTNNESTAIKVGKRTNQSHKFEENVKTNYTPELSTSTSTSNLNTANTIGDQQSTTGRLTLPKELKGKEDFNTKEQKVKTFAKDENLTKTKATSVGQDTRAVTKDETGASSTAYPEVQGKVGRKNKKRVQKSSASNSENDDVVETSSTSQKKSNQRKERNSVDAAKTSTTKSTLKTDVSIESKTTVEEELESSMVQSFLKTKERKCDKLENQEQIDRNESSLTSQNYSETKQEAAVLKCKLEGDVLSKTPVLGEQILTLERFAEKETEMKELSSSSSRIEDLNKHLKGQNCDKIQRDISTIASETQPEINNGNKDAENANKTDETTKSKEEEQEPLEDPPAASNESKENLIDKADGTTGQILVKDENFEELSKAAKSSVEIEISEEQPLQNPQTESVIKESSAGSKSDNSQSLEHRSIFTESVNKETLSSENVYFSSTTLENSEKLVGSIEINPIEESNKELLTKLDLEGQSSYSGTTSHKSIAVELETNNNLTQAGAEVISPTPVDKNDLLPLKLPALPPLKPLDLLINSMPTSTVIAKDFSLINFESPLQENQTIESNVADVTTTVATKDISEQNLIYALCSSLHYENEQLAATNEKPDISSAYSSAHSFSVLEDRLFNENEDPYLSFEQSSQDLGKISTPHTIVNNKNKIFGSSNSSGSEDLITVEDVKITKKQKRKKQQQQQQQQQQQKQKPNFQLEMDDEELLPLIAMTESQSDCIPDLKAESNPKDTERATNANSSTTDSEELMPTTTSDDNGFPITITTGNKIKTKKLEHKINLIAAIEAATSSSTSSAEESGVELNTNPTAHHHEDALITINALSPSGVAGSVLPLIATVSSNTLLQTASGMTKKKSKRRKR